MKTWKRLLAIAMVLAMLCTFGCVFFLVSYPGHACCGSRCLFCGVLNAVDTMLHQVSFSFVFLAGTALLLSTVLRLERRAFVRRSVPHTPITLKTKLLR